MGLICNNHKCIIELVTWFILCDRSANKLICFKFEKAILFSFDPLLLKKRPQYFGS